MIRHRELRTDPSNPATSLSAATRPAAGSPLPSCRSSVMLVCHHQRAACSYRPGAIYTTRSRASSTIPIRYRSPHFPAPPLRTEHSYRRTLSPRRASQYTNLAYSGHPLPTTSISRFTSSSATLPGTGVVQTSYRRRTTAAIMYRRQQSYHWTIARRWCG